MNRTESQWEQPELSFDAQRGIALHGPSHRFLKNSPNLGTHWTVDPEVADRFTFRNDVPKAALYTANIPMSSVETDNNALRNAYRWEGEKEVTVKKGAPVFLTSKTTFNRREGKGDYTKQRKRTIKFEKPKEMKA